MTPPMTPTPPQLPSPARAVRAVTVFCSSSPDVAAVYVDAARELGAALAARRWTLVYGGNSSGLMGVVADAARAAGGRVVGVTPRLFVDLGVADTKADELVVVDDMRQRKAVLEQRGDAFVVLPGGLGTLEELSEAIVGRQLGYHDKPVVLVDIDGYWAPLVAWVRHGVASGFVRPRALGLFHVVATVAAALAAVEADSGAGGGIGDFTHEGREPPSADAPPTR